MPDQWVVFGFGDYLSDIMDIIHANGGQIKAIVGNISYTQEEKNNLQHRLATLDYRPSVLDLQAFEKEDGEKYFYGINGHRIEVIDSLKKSHNIKFANLIHLVAQGGPIL